ncbi:DUF2817 domain-containing protein [Bradyrhizobium sp. WSM2254]|uniref:DUF2817 domain-containing protein n=1 Tax=Bradyrhizobium sp. WSM2254 TaxID=1188263 RepID=UPI003525CA7C
MDRPRTPRRVANHPISPWGFPWDRRVTQDGCDLSRQFIDFTVLLRQDNGYDGEPAVNT